jgi:hypothetical protein
MGLGWDLFSRISCSETHHMAARNTGVLPVSARALAMQHARPEGCAYAAMCGSLPWQNHALG